MTTTDTTDTVWSKALAELREKGWRGWGRNGTGESGEETCLVLAVVHQSATDYRVPEEIMADLYDALGVPSHLPRTEGVSALYEWNDAPERTFEDVEEVLTNLHNQELQKREEM